MADEARNLKQYKELPENSKHYAEKYLHQEAEELLSVMQAT